MVAFEGGQVELDLRLAPDGGISASVDPVWSAFVRASGCLHGTPFLQESYWKLVYSAGHHHFQRSFGVLFDAPIDGACGIEVDRIDVLPGAAPPRVYTVDCMLGRLGELRFAGHFTTDG